MKRADPRTGRIQGQLADADRQSTVALVADSSAILGIGEESVATIMRTSSNG